MSTIAQNLDPAAILKIRAATRSHLRECEEDETGLSMIVSSAREIFECPTDDQVVALTFAMIRELLADNRVRAGHFERVGPKSSKPGGYFGTFQFVVWDLTHDETIERIEREWIELGKFPHPGDIVWFTILGESLGDGVIAKPSGKSVYPGKTVLSRYGRSVDVRGILKKGRNSGPRAPQSGTW